MKNMPKFYRLLAKSASKLKDLSTYSVQPPEKPLAMFPILRKGMAQGSNDKELLENILVVNKGIVYHN